MNGEIFLYTGQRVHDNVSVTYKSCFAVATFSSQQYPSRQGAWPGGKGKANSPPSHREQVQLAYAVVVDAERGAIVIFSDRGSCLSIPS